MIKYLAHLTVGKTILWCYLIWYSVTTANHFDPAPAIWINSLGISAIIGFALVLSVARNNEVANGWQTFRLFLMPFCVSSFSALIKGKGFWLIFPPSVGELLIAAGACAAFVIIVVVAKRLYRRHAHR